MTTVFIYGTNRNIVETSFRFGGRVGWLTKSHNLWTWKPPGSQLVRGTWVYDGNVDVLNIGKYLKLQWLLNDPTSVINGLLDGCFSKLTVLLVAPIWTLGFLYTACIGIIVIIVIIVIIIIIIITIIIIIIIMIIIRIENYLTSKEAVYTSQAVRT